MNSAIHEQRIAVRAAIVRDGQVLLVRESPAYADGVHAGEYDFPGGRVDMGETVTDALMREVHEEVGIAVRVGKPFFVDEWRPVIQDRCIQIVGIFFVCEPLQTDVVLGTDHDEYQWVSISDTPSLPLMEPTKRALETLKLQALQ